MIKLGIKVFLAGLLFLRAPVMVDGKKHALVFLTGATEINGGFTAIASNFKARSQLTGFERKIVQPPALFVIQEAFYRVN
jgi:hypothetical protein